MCLPKKQKQILLNGSLKFTRKQTEVCKKMSLERTSALKTIKIWSVYGLGGHRFLKIIESGTPRKNINMYHTEQWQ